MKSSTAGGLQSKTRPREGRVLVVPENIEAVRKLVEEDYHGLYIVKLRRTLASVAQAYRQFCMNTYLYENLRRFSPSENNFVAVKTHVFEVSSFDGTNYFEWWFNRTQK